MYASFRTALAAAAIFIVLGTLIAAAQSDVGELRVAVTDATGGALVASGNLSSEAPQTLRPFRTDEQGRFTFEKVPFGVYRLIVERDGFSTSTTVIDLHSPLPRDVPVQLALSTIATQVDVSVTADRPLIDPNRTGVSFAIGAPVLQTHLSAVSGRRVLDLVDQQPGWLMEANGVLHPRGSEYQTLFVVDGVPMDENRSPAFAPDLQESEIHAMAVLTANFPAEYGRKLGGVVEVTTSKDIEEGFHGALDVGAGSVGTASAAFSGSHGWSRRALTISGSAARTDRYLDPPVLENFTNNGSLSGALATYQDRPSDRDRLHLTWQHRRSDFLVPNEIVQQTAGQRQENAGRDTTVHAAWTRILGSRFVLNTRGMVQRLSASLESNLASTPVIVDHERSFTRSYANASLAADFGRHQIKFGGDVVTTPVREALDYEITDESVVEENTRESFSFADRRRSSEQSLFVQDTIRAGAITVSAGLRWDRYAFIVRENAFSPRLGVAWAATPDIVLRASYDRVFQTPAVENLLLASSPLVDDVNPLAARIPVEPSHGHFFEGGVTAALWRQARFDLTGYRRTFTNFADDDVFLNTGVSFPVAFASAVIRGLDAKLTLPTWRRTSGFVSYALLKGTAELPVVGGLFIGNKALEGLEGSGTVAITQDQRHTLRAQARYHLSTRIWTAATIRYGSGLPVEIEDDLTLDELEEQYGDEILDRVDFDAGRVRANFTIDVGLGAELWRTTARRLTLRAEFANVTDRLNVINFAGVFSGTALAPPRSASVRLQYEF
jgi:outer membrane receptor protein involved in Fe transport